MASIIETFGPFVKDQIAYAEKQAARFLGRGEENKAKANQSRAAMFKQLYSALDEPSKAPTNNAATSSDSLRLTPADLEGLPEELLAELSLSDADRREFLIVELIDKLGGAASLDKILVEIFRATGEIEKRQKLVSRLYRMTSKGMLYPLPDRKGAYSTTPIVNSGTPSQPDEETTEEEIDDLL